MKKWIRWIYREIVGWKHDYHPTKLQVGQRVEVLKGTYKGLRGFIEDITFPNMEYVVRVNKDKRKSYFNSGWLGDDPDVKEVNLFKR